MHDQKGKNNCTSHAFATCIEYQLSNLLKERVLVNVDDLWEKQKKYGTAKDGVGDLIEGPMKIAAKYEVLFSTASGKNGIFFLGRGVFILKK
ncbi:MAG: hypothetical protein V2A63_00490 [Patescibacteria group bacterium]